MIEIKKLVNYDSDILNIIEWYFPEKLESLSEEVKCNLQHMLDFEGLEITVINDDTVVLHETSGDAIAVDSLEDFVNYSIEQAAEDEGSD